MAFLRTLFRNKIIGATDFLEAAYNGDLATVTKYIEQNKTNPGAINVLDKNGLNALIIAAMRNHPKMIDALLAAGIDVNATCMDGFTALMLAATNRSIEAFQALLKSSNIDVNMAAANGCTALHFSLGIGKYRDDTTMLECLLADPRMNSINAVTRHGTVMDMASERGPNVLSVLKAFTPITQDVSAPRPTR